MNPHEAFPIEGLLKSHENKLSQGKNIGGSPSPKKNVKQQVKLLCEPHGHFQRKVMMLLNKKKNPDTARVQVKKNLNMLSVIEDKLEEIVDDIVSDRLHQKLGMKPKCTKCPLTTEKLFIPSKENKSTSKITKPKIKTRIVERSSTQSIKHSQEKATPSRQVMKGRVPRMNRRSRQILEDRDKNLKEDISQIVTDLVQSVSTKFPEKTHPKEKTTSKRSDNHISQSKTKTSIIKMINLWKNMNLPQATIHGSGFTSKMDEGEPCSNQNTGKEIGKN